MIVFYDKQIYIRNHDVYLEVMPVECLLRDFHYKLMSSCIHNDAVCSFISCIKSLKRDRPYIQRFNLTHRTIN